MRKLGDIGGDDNKGVREKGECGWGSEGWGIVVALIFIFVG